MENVGLVTIFHPGNKGFTAYNWVNMDITYKALPIYKPPWFSFKLVVVSTINPSPVKLALCACAKRTQSLAHTI